jgi:hypothetical protein
MRNLAIAVVLGLGSLLVGGAGVAVVGITILAPLAVALRPGTRSGFVPSRPASSR